LAKSDRADRVVKSGIHHPAERLMGIEIGDLVIGLLMLAFSLVGLFLAAGAHDNEIYVFGLSLAGWGAVFIFGLLHRHFDRRDAMRIALPLRGEQPHE
jgi:hypothetical protein